LREWEDKQITNRNKKKKEKKTPHPEHCQLGDVIKIKRERKKGKDGELQD